MVYKRLNWGDHEPLFSDKLNNMVANDDWLYQNMLTGYYNVLGITRDSGLSARVGYVKGINTPNLSFFASHYYSKPFIPGTRPIVVTGVLSAASMRIMTGVKGLDQRAIPDHRGFLVHFSQAVEAGGVQNKFDGEFYAGYVSIGPNG